ncbi:MAG TPA: cobyrinate a,c-diamide synthase [Kofleriaceae bacterium]|jgi:cobyrinic acid a,c-diamide synthase|nr:cobyrinate a,c-diamide synthase [Kofleriaceae bacterium]
MVARLVIAGTASGVGKTTVTVGLIRALRARGLRVAVFKCGPDYLDPTYHVRAADAACHNLDGWMMGPDAVAATFARAARGADVALIEGVMGLYDGASPTSDEGSTAEIARWLAAPVVLVCDASGMARSVAALARGFAAFDPGLRIAGVVCNRIGGRGHLDLLRAACGGDPPVLGGLPVEAALGFPDRHLGLHTADREHVPEAQLAAWGERAAAWLDVDALLAAARAAPALNAPAAPPTDAAPVCRIGLALDEAFHFYYDDNLRQLEQLGAELVRFSPVHDAQLPEVDGLYLGGGYPELHAEALAANAAMRAAIAGFGRAGGPIYAECGGLMYLASAIRTLDGRRHEMLGLLPGEVEMRDRLVALGYVEVETQAATPLGAPGLRFRGHQFRYSELRLTGEVDCAYAIRRRYGGEVSHEGYRIGNALASYVHAHWASSPDAARGLVAACAAHRGRPR